jgi:hypothetical protein
MKLRTLLLLVMLITLAWLFKPANATAEAKRLWRQRDLMLRTLVVIILVYLVYGFYELYQRGGIPLGE